MCFCVVAQGVLGGCLSQKSIYVILVSIDLRSLLQRKSIVILPILPLSKITIAGLSSTAACKTHDTISLLFTISDK